MTGVLLAVDLLIVAFVCTSGLLWLKASRNRVRRISRNEVLDAADINRIVTALNRSQILSSRAAMATACAAGFAMLRLLLDARILL